MLDQLAVPHPEDVDELPLHRVPTRRMSPQLAAMGSAECLAGGDEITLCELLVDLHRRVRKPLEQLAVEALEPRCGPIPVCGDRPSLGGVVVGEVRMEDLIREAEIMPVLAHLDEPGDDL